MGVSINNLAKMTIQSLQTDGVKKTAKRGYSYLSCLEPRAKQYRKAISIYADVLFINGCDLPHPSRYRVSHQIEQLLAKNIVASEVYYTNITLDLVKRYRLFIFYRCPYTDTVGEFIAMIKKCHKHVLFDVDDLVIDESYSQTVEYLKTLSQHDQDSYYDGVRLMQKTLKLCEGAITTTETLAQELKKYVPRVFINRNLASAQMIQLSEKAFNARLNMHSYNTVDIGYFSGSITHNQDFEMILPAIIRLMNTYDNVRLSLVGKIALPDELKVFDNRVVYNEFVDWRKLPALLASVDINIAPIEKTIFNSAKSENKWIEAALVRVPTIASNVGAFSQMVENKKTGILCENTIDAWYLAMESLVKDADYRAEIAQNAYLYVIKNCSTIVKSVEFAEYVKSWLVPNIFMVFPQIQISGKIMVPIQHCILLIKRGYDVTILNENNVETQEEVIFEGYSIPVLNKRKVSILGSIDIAVGTFYTSMNFVTTYVNIKKRVYLVQGYETNLFRAGEALRVRAEQTYSPTIDVKFITTSKWCEKWLREKYHHESRYVPVGIDSKCFYPEKRKFGSKIRVLIVGSTNDYYIDTNEVSCIADRLDKEKYEIRYMSYQGEKNKKRCYKDRFLHQTSYNRGSKIYGQCDILIQTSINVGSLYLLLEMMATGGFVVAIHNKDNSECLVDEENCMMYSQGDIDKAINCIERITKESVLRDKLYQNGIETVKARDWSKIEADTVCLYE